ncbi:unnamed protein product [Protopolystoma xenopodis]|uniref:Uncharacterized protein n=1 Tax=Protopolystoma xenopodis TaxID=117903 RepID=A0A3S5BDR7_9PLAT|nr:unnamed protein product [Protopolystoma xenopodis]
MMLKCIHEMMSLQAVSRRQLHAQSLRLPRDMTLPPRYMYACVPGNRDLLVTSSGLDAICTMSVNAVLRVCLTVSAYPTPNGCVKSV